jgi:hypothetical protein
MAAYERRRGKSNQMIFETIALGFVCWLVTMIIVDSELVRPIRDWIDNKRTQAERDRKLWWAMLDGYDPEDDWETGLDGSPRIKRRIILWRKARYLVGCYLCTGVWVGLILSALTLGIAPLGGGVLGWLLNGLLYKAVGHCVLIWQKYMEAHS